MLRFHTLRRIRGPADLRRLAKVEEFYRVEFPSSPQFMEALKKKIHQPLKVNYAATLVTAEGLNGEVLGFAFYDHFADLGLSYLEYIVTAPGQRGQGVGGGLYEAMRESLVYDGSEGLLFEVNPDDPDLPPDVLAANRATLKFYEKYDARPLEGVRFDYPPFRAEAPRLLIVYDDLGHDRPIEGARLKAFIRKLYQVKYNADPRDKMARAIIDAVPEGPIPYRPNRYLKPERVVGTPSPGSRLILVEAIVSEAHRSHVIPERDYLERPLRVERLLKQLRQMPFVSIRPPKRFPDRHVLAIHDAGMVRYLRNASALLQENEIINPTVFPIRRRLPAPGGQPTHAGYYSIDSFTPLTRNAYPAARAAVDVALTAAERVKQGIANGPVYALTRPPGHHAEKDVFGGFCYFNNGAIAAHYLTEGGRRVTLLDVDFHHGNGAQQIFYHREDVQTVSIHGDPRVSYPYFVGFEHEKGDGPGLGYNHNFPLPEGIGDDEYLATLRKALKRIEKHEPDYLVVALGLDVSKDDPSGSFRVTRKGFYQMGELIAGLGIPSMLTQEGGYNLRHLAGNLSAFLTGWMKGTR